MTTQLMFFVPRSEDFLMVLTYQFDKWIYQLKVSADEFMRLMEMTDLLYLTLTS